MTATSPKDQDAPHDRAERRAAAIVDAQIRTGIDEALIHTLVHRFYDRIRADDILGPVFAARITDWEPHLARMCAFWSSVTLHSGRYGGRPMQAHTPLPVSGAHFDRWLALFGATADELGPPNAADEFKAKARMIAASLELGVASFRGIVLKPGERLPAQGQTPTPA
jgi:hemoglobin